MEEREKVVEEESIFNIVDEEDLPQEAPKETAAAPAADDTLEKLKKLYEEQLKVSTEAVKGSNEAILKTVQSIQPQQPGESQDDFRTRIEKAVFEKPFDAIMEVIQKTSGPINGQIVSNQMRQGKKLTYFGLEASDQAMFKRYEAEVDEEFGKIPLESRFADPEGAYEKAYTLVKARHLNDIIEEERKKMEKKEPAAAPAAMLDGNAPKGPATAPKETRIVLKAGQRQRIESWMKANNVEVTPKNFANIVEVLHDRGELAGF